MVEFFQGWRIFRAGNEENRLYTRPRRFRKVFYYQFVYEIARRLNREVVNGLVAEEVGLRTNSLGGAGRNSARRCGEGPFAAFTQKPAS